MSTFNYHVGCLEGQGSPIGSTPLLIDLITLIALGTLAGFGRQGVFPHSVGQAFLAGAIIQGLLFGTVFTSSTVCLVCRVAK